MDMIETTGTQLRQSILDGFSKALAPKWPPSPTDLMAPEDVIPDVLQQLLCYIFTVDVAR